MTEKIFQKRNGIFKVRITLAIFFSAIIGFFNFAVLYWFGIPILGLLIGLTLVLLSKVNIKTKFILTIIPIPIILSFFFLFFLFLPKAEPENFIIPQNFKGEFQIIFKEPCGQPLIYEEDQRVYRIPSNGILITNAKETLGVIDRKFYLIDENEKLILVPKYYWSNFEREKDDWHWLFSSSQLSYDSVGIFWAYHNSFNFFVSSYRYIEEETKEKRAEREKQFHSKSEVLLKECRKT